MSESRQLPLSVLPDAIAGPARAAWEPDCNWEAANTHPGAFELLGRWLRSTPTATSLLAVMMLPLLAFFVGSVTSKLATAAGHPTTNVAELWATLGLSLGGAMLGLTAIILSLGPIAQRARDRKIRQRILLGQQSLADERRVSPDTTIAVDLQTLFPDRDVFAAAPDPGTTGELDKPGEPDVEDLMARAAEERVNANPTLLFASAIIGGAGAVAAWRFIGPGRTAGFATLVTAPALWIMFLRLRNRARRQVWQSWARARGMDFRRSAEHLSLPGLPLTGYRATLRDAAMGSIGTIPCLTGHLVVTERTGTTRGGSTNLTCEYGAVIMHLPPEVAARFPGISCTAALSINAPVDPLAFDGGRAVPESITFHSLYTVSIRGKTNDLTVRELLSPPFVDMLSREFIEWQQVGEWLVVFCRHAPDSGAELDALCRQGLLVHRRYCQEYR